MIKTTEKIEGKLIQSINGADRQRIDIFFLEEENKYFIFLDCDTRRVLLLTDELLMISVGNTFEETLENITVSDSCKLTSRLQLFGNSLYNTQEMVGYFYTFEDLRNAKIIKVPVEEIIRDVKHVAHMYTQDISVQGA